MRFLTPEQALARLQSSKNVLGAYYQDRSSSGNLGMEVPKVSDEVKALTFAHAAAGMRINEVADLFGLSPSAAREYARGEKRVSSGTYVADEKLTALKNDVGQTIVEKATNIALAALETVTSKGLLNKEDNKLRDVTGAAKDLASVIEKFQPKRESGNVAAVILMGTLPYGEDRYKTINVEAKVG